MSRLQSYTNMHCRFIHDDRGRMCVIGDVCWLKPARAQKILEEMRKNGIESAIEPTQGAPVSRDPDPTSLFDAGCVLSLPAKARRSIARALGAPKNVRTKVADDLISNADLAELKAASAYYIGG